MTNPDGSLRPNLTVRLMEADSTNLITAKVYAEDGSSTELGNPFVCASGVIDFYLDASTRINLGVTPRGDGEVEQVYECLDVLAAYDPNDPLMVMSPSSGVVYHITVDDTGPQPVLRLTST
jgi:hypothetical protein